MEMTKQVMTFIMITIIISTLSANAQYVFENRDIILEINLKTVNDTTITISGSVVNKLTHRIYSVSFPSSFQHDVVYFRFPKDELIIDSGGILDIPSIEYLMSVSPIDSEDTLFIKETIISNLFRKKNRLHLSFAYLDIESLNKKEKKEITLFLTHKDPEIYDCPSFRRYCKWFMVEMPYHPDTTLSNTLKL